MTSRKAEYMAAMNHVNKSTRCLAIGEGPYMVLIAGKAVDALPIRRLFGITH